MTSVYFIRHCQSDSSVHDDHSRPLTEKGLCDRALVTAYLSDKGIDAVYSSPYQRAVDTVSELAHLHALDVETIEDFRERKSPWLRGLSDLYFATFVRHQWEDFSFKLGDGENLSEVQERNIAALTALLNLNEDKSIAIGSHGTALATIINYFDPTFGYAQFMEIIDVMPWVVVMHFDENGFCGMERINLLKPDTRA